MKTADIINLSWKKEENREIIKKCLKRIPLLADINEVTSDDLDKIIRKIRKKYPIRIGYIMNGNDDVSCYAFMIKHEDGRWLTTIYALTLFEGLAKTLIFMYDFIKRMERE